MAYDPFNTKKESEEAVGNIPLIPFNGGATPEVIRKNAHLTRSLPPDQAADDYNTAQKAGLSPDIVSRNRDAVKSQTEAEEIQSKVAEFPGTARYLSRQENMAVSRDDTDNLVETESTLKRAGGAMVKFLPRAVYSMAAGVNDMLSLGAGGLDYLTQKGEQVTGLERGGAFGGARDWLQWQSSSLRKKLNEDDFLGLSKAIKDKRLIENPSLLLDPEWLITNVGDTAASMVPALMAAYASGGSTAVAGLVGGAQEGGALYSEMVQEGEVSEDAALSAAMTYGLISAYLNKIGFDEILDKTAVKSIKERIARSLVKGGVEAATEWAEEPAQALVKTLTEGGTPAEILEAVKEAAKNIDVIPGAFLMGGGMSYASAEYRRDVANMVLADQDKQFFEALDNLAAGSKTKIRVPEKYAQFFDFLKDQADGVPENIFVNAELFQQAIQSTPEILTDIDMEAEFSEALATGGDLSIPIGVYARYIAGTDLSAALRSDLRVRQDGMSAREADQARQDWAETMRAQIEEVKTEKEAADNFEKERQQVYDDVLARRQAVGRVGESAQSDAAYWAAFAATWAKRYGGTPLGVYRQIAPDVRAEQWQGQTAGELNQTGDFKTIEDIQEKYKDSVKTLFLHEDDSSITLESIIVDKAKRKGGLGSQVLADIVSYADSTGKRILLSPGTKDDRHGTTSRNRLVKFYKRFGFVENKGRNKDFSLSKAMYREPKTLFQTAYHGSPHTFEKFSIGMMGAGEGAQAYGWGLYFTDKKEIADWYKDQLSAKNLKGVDGKKYGDSQKVAEQTAWALMVKKLNAPKEFEQYLDGGQSYLGKIAQDIEDGKITYDKGRTYKVDLMPKEDEYLLWDKPLNEQSEKVKNALEKNRWLFEQYQENLSDSERTGSDIYYGFQNINTWPNAEKAGIDRKTWRDKQSAEQAASDFLKAIGIRGVKYLDGSSRADGEGSYNYVIFDDADVKIVEYYQKDAPLWYSQMQEYLFEKLPGKGTGKSFLNTIQSWAKKGEFKQEELEWSGLVEWLKEQDGKVSKQDVINYLAENNVRVEEVEKGKKALSFEEWVGRYMPNTPQALEPPYRRTAEIMYNNYLEDDESSVNAGATKFSSYQLPGGGNYKELLLTLPRRTPPTFEEWKNHYSTKGWLGTEEEAREMYAVDIEYGGGDKVGYKSSHWDEPNVLAHIRFNERTGPDGEKVLFIEEIQSDWHQEGRQKGYQRKPVRAEKTSSENWYAVYDSMGYRMGDFQGESEADALKEAGTPDGEIPNAPFKKSWPLLAFKRMVRYAAENNFDTIAWAPGEVQADRYDLSKQVEDITARLFSKNDNVQLRIGTKQGTTEQIDTTRDKLPDYVGKDLADKILKQEVGRNIKYEGLDLKVGGEGMKGFYDKILPAEVNKFFNKAQWGNAKVETTTIETEDEDIEVWSLSVTPEMQEKALAGMPLFQDSGTPKGSVSFTDTKPIVKLFENANPSTFLHESGHIFFNFMGESAAAADAPAELKTDWGTILDYVGNDGTEPLTTDQHEKLARALESYFMEGKTPSLKLRSVFRKFADWLKALYKHVSNLGAPVTPELQSVFDRMFAADQEIEEARQFYDARKPFFEEADLMNDEERTRYQALRSGAQAAAEDTRLRKYARAHIQAMGGVGEIRKQVAAEIKAQPVYAAMDAAVKKGGFFIGDVEDLIGTERKNQLAKKRPGMVTVKGNADLNLTAAEHGFDSPAEMIDAMMAAETKDKATKRRVAEILTHHEKVIRDGLSKDNLPPADGDYHSDAQLAVIAAEAQMLAQRRNLEKGREKSRARQIETAAVRDVAREVLSNKLVSEATSHYRYSLAEAKAARQAREAYRNGDLEKAEKLKRRELLNHALVLEAVAVREQHISIMNRLKRSMRRDIDEHYTNQVTGLLNKFGLTERQPQDGAKTFAAFMESLNTLDAETPMGYSSPTWSDWLYDDTKRPEPGKTYKTTLTFAELTELDKAVTWLVETGYDIKKGRLASYKESLNDLREEMIGPMISLKNKKVRKKGSFLRKLSDDTRRYIADHDMLPFILDTMDGYSNVGPKGSFGPNRRIIGNALAERQNRRDTMMESAVKALEPIMEQLKTSSKKHPRMIRTDIPVPELLRQDGDFWTFEKVLAVALNMGNETNFQRIQAGYNLGPEECVALTSILTREDWEAVQKIWDHINSYWEELNDVHYRTNHFHREKVKARPIAVTAADGSTVELNGGYYPLEYDPHLSARAAGWTEKDDLMQQSVWGHPGVKAGMTKTRTEHRVELPVNLSLSVLYTHIEDTIHYITHADVIKDLDRITQSGGYHDVVKEKLGDEVYQLIRPTLRHIARPERAVGVMLDRKLDKMRALSTAYILGLNTSVAIKQVFSVPGIINDIGVGAYVKGVAKVLKSPIESFNAMQEMSAYMKTRSKSFDRELQDSLGKLRSGPMGLKPGLIDAARDWSFALIRLMDFLAVYPSWWGAYAQGMIKEGGYPEAAAQYADEMIRQSQPSSKPMDLSAIQRSSKGLTRALSMFMTFTAKYGNRQRFYYRGWREGKINTRTYARHLLLESVAPPLLMNLMFAAMWGEDPDPEDAMIDTLLYQFSGYVLVRELAGVGGYYAKKYGFEKDAYRPDLSKVPAFEGLDVVQRSAETLVKWLTDMGDDEQQDKAVWAFAELAGFWAGVPVPKLFRKLKEGMRQFDEGEGTAFNMIVPNSAKREN